MHSMMNIFISVYLHSYLIEFSIVKWKLWNNLPRCFHGPAIQVAPSGIPCSLGPVSCLFGDKRDSAMEVGNVGLNFFKCRRH